MDPLSDLLRIVRLDGAYFYGVEAAEPWSAETLPAAQLTPRIMPASEHLISYHILTQGKCWGVVAGHDPVELSAGDVIVFPHGDAHQMCSAPGVRTGRDVYKSLPERYPFTVNLSHAGAPTTSIVCGFLGCDRRPFNPLLASLPRIVVVRRMSNDWLGNFVRQVTEDSRQGRSGARGVLTRLAELMFVEVLRRYVDDLPAGHTGWLAGLRDEVVGKALGLLHERPGRAWTLVTLAKGVGTSRSNLARRFTGLMGQPPMKYLAQWRMQVAAHLLTQSDAKLSAVGSEVGYDSEAAFSRAFKKATGVSPGAWREGGRQREP